MLTLRSVSVSERLGVGRSVAWRQPTNVSASSACTNLGIYEKPQPMQNACQSVVPLRLSRRLRGSAVNILFRSEAEPPYGFKGSATARPVFTEILAASIT